MVAWIVRVKGGTAASLIDPLLRPQIVARYAAIKPAVDAMLKAEALAEQFRDGEAPGVPEVAVIGTDADLEALRAEREAEGRGKKGKGK